MSQPCGLQQRLSAFLTALGFHAAQTEHHVLQGGQMRKQRVILKHQPDAAFLRRHMNHGGGQGLVTGLDQAAINLLQARNCAKQGAFACAGRPQNGGDPAEFQRQVRLVQNPVVLPGFLHVARIKNRLTHRAVLRLRLWVASHDTAIMAGRPSPISISEGRAA